MAEPTDTTASVAKEAAPEPEPISRPATPVDDDVHEEPRSIMGIIGTTIIACAVIMGVVATTLQFLPSLMPIFGPSVNTQLTELSATIEGLTVLVGAHDEILVLGELTGETTVDAATGNTIAVRGPSLVQRVNRSDSDLAEHATRLQNVEVVSNRADDRSTVNAGGITALRQATEDGLKKAQSARWTLTKKMEAIRDSLAATDIHLAAQTDSIRLTALAANTKAAFNTDRLNRHDHRMMEFDQRTTTLEAVNTFLYTGDDMALNAAIENGSVSQDLAAGIMAGRRAVEKYRSKK